MTRWLLTILLTAVLGLSIRAQETPVWADSIPAPDTAKPKKSFLKKAGQAFDAVGEFLNGCDSTYITPQLYEFTTQLELSTWRDFYHMRSSITKNSMDIQSHYSTILGGYVYWNIFGFGYQWNLSDVGVRTGPNNSIGLRRTFVINTGRFFFEYFLFNSGRTANITKVSGLDLKNLDTRFTGLSSKCTGLTIDYIFNHRHYSWPAAFGQSSVQRKNSGSFKLGFTWNHQRIKLDRSQLPLDISEKMDTTLLFNKVDYVDWAVSFGYGYNLVLRRNCLFAISLLPSLGYRGTDIQENERHHFSVRNISTDLVTRASLVWNNTKTFTGLMFELHTYSYRDKSFGLTNNYGMLKLVVGMNFVKKKEYKHPK